MSVLLHPIPSAGSVIKRITEINPDLSPQEVMAIIQKSMRVQGASAGDFATAQIIDNAEAERLTKATLGLPHLITKSIKK